MVPNSVSEDLPHSSGIKTLRHVVGEDYRYVGRLAPLIGGLRQQPVDVQRVYLFVGRLSPYWSSGFSDNFKRRPSENAGRNRWYLIAK